MEIRHYGDTILGVVTEKAMYEGRMVVLDAHSETYGFGSREDLPGVRPPANSTEARRARYVLAFAVDNRSLPIYEPTPFFTFALRHGWDQTANVPFDAEVQLTHPSNKLGQVVPSGALALAYGEGIYTVPSGSYVYSATMEVPGTQLAVTNIADDGGDDAGMLFASVDAFGDDVVAEVYHFDDDTAALTFKILH
jgi:hypothetical protein